MWYLLILWLVLIGWIFWLNDVKMEMFLPYINGIWRLFGSGAYFIEVRDGFVWKLWWFWDVLNCLTICRGSIYRCLQRWCRIVYRMGNVNCVGFWNNLRRGWGEKWDLKNGNRRESKLKIWCDVWVEHIWGIWEMTFFVEM